MASVARLRAALVVAALDHASGTVASLSRVAEGFRFG
jgi:hypothetical protein